MVKQIHSFLALVLLVCFSLSAQANALEKALSNAFPNLGLADSAPEFLEPEHAFPFSLNGSLNSIHIGIQPGYYLYKDKLKFYADGTLLNVALPEALEKNDPYFGPVFIYDAPLTIPFENLSRYEALIIHYQGCALQGICYPPLKLKLDLKTKAFSSIETLPSSPQKAASPTLRNEQLKGKLSDQDQIVHLLNTNGLWLTLLVFFGSGLLLAFTPCVLPMLPILSGIIVGQKTQKRKALSLSITYVLSMSLTYSLVGVAAAVLGQNLQAALQTPLVTRSMAAIFILLALSMFGLYSLSIPNRIQAFFTQLSSRAATGRYISAIFMGILSVIIIGPCVAPALAGALLYITQSGDAWTGGLSLFFLSLGMGLPLALFSVAANRFLPKAGSWMAVSNHFLGALLLAIAIYMLDRSVPDAVTILLSALLLLLSACYLFSLSKNVYNGWKHCLQTLSIFALTQATLLSIGVASGGSSLIQPLAHLNHQGPTGYTAVESIFTPLNPINLSNKLQQIEQQQTATLFYVTADWCISCKELEAFVFSNPLVAQQLKRIKPYKIDITENNLENTDFLKAYQLSGPPALLFIDETGSEIRPLRTIGLIDSEKLVEYLELLKP